MTHWKQLQNRDYLGHWDLSKNEERKLEIIEVKKKAVFNQTNNQEEQLIVCSFKTGKPMILNTTNCKTIEKLYKTPLIEEWVGKQISIKVDKIKAFGEFLDCLRVMTYVPSTKVIKCEGCKKEIKAYGKMNASQLATYTNEQYGKSLCSECAQKANNQEDE